MKKIEGKHSYVYKKILRKALFVIDHFWFTTRTPIFQASRLKFYHYKKKIMKAYLLAFFLTSFKHCRQIQDRKSLVPVPLIKLSENPVDLSIKNVMSLVVANNNRANSTLRYTFPFTFVLISLCQKKFWKKKSVCTYYVNISILQARAPVFSKRKLDWAQMAPVLKIRNKNHARA